MGAYLSEPITKKESSNETGKNVAYGASSMQGWRISQEVSGNPSSARPVQRRQQRGRDARARAHTHARTHARMYSRTVIRCVSASFEATRRNRRRSASRQRRPRTLGMMRLTFVSTTFAPSCVNKRDISIKCVPCDALVDIFQHCAITFFSYGCNLSTIFL